MIILSFAASNSHQNIQRAKTKHMTSGKVREYFGSEQMTILFMVWQRHFPTLRQAAGCSEKPSHKERQLSAKKKCLLSKSQPLHERDTNKINPKCSTISSIKFSYSFQTIFPYPHMVSHLSLIQNTPRASSHTLIPIIGMLSGS